MLGTRFVKFYLLALALTPLPLIDLYQKPCTICPCSVIIRSRILDSGIWKPADQFWVPGDQEEMFTPFAFAKNPTITTNP